MLFSVIASNYQIKNDSFLSAIREFHSQVDSPKSPETPEITEIIENFIKVNNDLTKLKEALTNYVWETSHFKNGKKRKPGNAANRQKAF